VKNVKLNHIYHGDCLEVMKRIPDESVDCIVTSPPYFLKKEYEKTWSWEQYDALMLGFFRESERILKGGAYLVINFGDYFNSGNRFYDADVPSVYPATVPMFEWGMKFSFDLQATRIWRKQFAKMGIPFVCNSHPRNIFDYEHIWTFRKRNGNKTEFVNDRKLSQRGVIGEDWKSQAGLGKHCAAFPLELPEWAIKVYSKKGDTVLDPFIGSGTTAIACINTGRNFIGIEKEQKYVELARRRVELARRRVEEVALCR
jgi:DNA modification methylase